VLDGDPAPLPERGRSPQFSARVYCGETAGWIRMPLGRQVGLSQSDIVLVGDPAPPPQNGSRAPNFRPCLLWPDCWMDQDATWRGGRSWPRPHCARWGPSSPSPKVHSPKFSAHVCCGQMAGWIKMPLGREIGLSPNDIVLDGAKLPLAQKGWSPNFRPMSIVAKQLDGSRWHLVRR